MPSATMTKDNKKGAKPPKHWTQRMHECVLTRDESGSINIAVKGGAENGMFPYISFIQGDRITVQSGKMHVDEILMEVNGHKLAGYTLWDIEALFKHLGDVSFHFKLLKQGQTLSKDLRRYLNMRFQKGSIDHDLQSTIRENLYVRTVPCTTRTPRDGEVNGVDYKFLSVDEFMALEKSGHLLESGLFEGNHYGTPKPPIHPPKQQQQHNEEPKLGPPTEGGPPPKKPSDHRPGARPSSSGKRARNKSTITATTLNAAPVDEEEQRRRDEIERLTEELGILPSNWEIAFTDQGDMYFIDHISAATQWLDPRLESKQKQELLECEDDELPYGWEKIDDPQYGQYFIDHINRKTQYENPVVKAKAVASSQSASTLPRRKPPMPPQRARSTSDLPNQSAVDSGAVMTTSDSEWRAMFTKDPEELKGEMITTTLCKSTVGFGFTIVGGDDPEEFLQVKSVVPNGPAYSDGILKTGDVLVHVNDTLVLGYTHHEVVGMFQTIKPGQKIKLDVCRGYPLPFDPDDPNTNIVKSYANLSLPVSPNKAASMKSTQSVPEKLSNHTSPFSYAAPNDIETASRSSRNSGEHPVNNQGKSLPNLTPQLSKESGDKIPAMLGVGVRAANDRGSISSDQTTDSQTSIQPEVITVTFVKGSQGFGFTVADSPFGQKVKQILAPQRCKTLQEGDIMVEINNEYIRDMPHNAVVQRLKECPQGQETVIVVQRGGMLKPVRGISKTSSPSSKNSQSPEIPRIQKSTSEHSLSSAHRGHPPTSRDDDLRSSSDEFERRSQDDMRRLKRNRTREKERLSPAHEKGETAGKPKSPEKGHERLNGRYHDSDRESEDRQSHHSDRGHHSDRDRHNLEWEQGSNKSPDRRLHDKANNISKLEADIQHSPHDRRRDQHRPEYARNSPQKDRRPSDHRPRDDYDRKNDRRVNDYDSKSLDRQRGPRPSDSHRKAPPHGEHDPRTRDAERRRPKTPNYDSRSLPPDEIRKHNPRFPNEWHDDLKYNNSKGEKGRGRPSYYRGPTAVHKQDDSLPRRSPSRGRPTEDPDSIESTVFLKKHADGFGFRIIGGHEEGSQVSIGNITTGGAADLDGRIRNGDELLYVDGQTVHGASHRQVVDLMKDANEAGRVSLGIRRHNTQQEPEKHQQPQQQPPQQPQHHQQQPQHQQSQQPQHQQSQQRVQPQPPTRAPPSQMKSGPSGFPYEVTLTRRGNEGFGFVILSSTLKSGSKIGRIIPGSPADRSTNVNVGDRLTAVNGVDITMLNHKDIVNIIKDTGSSVTLTIAAPEELNASPTSPKGSEPMFNAMAMPAHIKNNEQSHQPAPQQSSQYSHNAMSPQSEHRRAEILYAQPAQWRSPQENADPRRFENRQQQQPTPIPGHMNGPPPTTSKFFRQPIQDQIEPGEYYSVEFDRGHKGFGFSIRGGREYQNTPLFVLRMAIDGPAVKEGRMMVGDQLIEINGYSTEGMLHTEAIAAIKSGGQKVRLLLRRSGKPPVMDMNPRRYAQTPPPTFHNAHHNYSTMSGSNIRNYYDTASEGGTAQDGFDNNWSYRSLPRGMKY